MSGKSSREADLETVFLSSRSELKMPQVSKLLKRMEVLWLIQVIVLVLIARSSAQEEETQGEGIWHLSLLFQEKKLEYLVIDHLLRGFWIDLVQLRVT